MKNTLILTGDINLMGNASPDIPFSKVAGHLKRADVVFSNLECCFYDTPDARDSQIHKPLTGVDRLQREGFQTPTALAEALVKAGISAVGNANNVNYGKEAIASSLARLDALGIPHSGAGLNRRKAEAPVIVTGNGLRFGMFQRTAVYWPVEHKALDHSPGVATIKAHTAYRPFTDGDAKAPNRPGIPPEVVTWMDPRSTAEITAQVKALKKKCHIAVPSFHWGLNEDVLAYQRELAHAVIDAGADVVMGHSPHMPLPIEIYKKKPIFYGLGSFSFYIGHGGKLHGDWIGLVPRLTYEGRRLQSLSFRIARHNAKNETIFRTPKQESRELERLQAKCDEFGTQLRPRAGDVAVRL